jgi:hypothetical protein
MTRVWMITYYIDVVTNPSRPQLIRQVNWPGYPASGAANPPTVLADVIEDLQLLTIFRFHRGGGFLPQWSGKRTSAGLTRYPQPDPRHQHLHGGTFGNSLRGDPAILSQQPDHPGVRA